MQRRLPLLLALIAGWTLGAQRAYAHPDGHASSEPYPAVEQHRPTPLPDRVVLTWSDDPASTIDVTYRTSGQVVQTICELIEADKILGDHQTGDIAEAEHRQGRNETFTSDLGEFRIHTVRLRDLTPATKYAYRVGDGANWSEWHHFKTASTEPEPFEFLYFGDAQNAVRALWSRVRREAHAEAPRAAFALHAGDLINSSNSDAEWGEWHEAAGWINATIPTVATPGNHEYAVVDLKPTISGHWRPQFSFPTNGPKGLEESCYWFDYQGTRIIALNSNEAHEEQAEWLDRTLSDLPPANWTIVSFHHPIFSAAKNRDNGTLREIWRPVIDKHGIDLALTGHDHAYSRSGLGGPLDAPDVNLGDGLRTKRGKTVYVVSVSGPKNYPLSDSWDVSRSGSGIQLYQTVQVERHEIHYRAFRATGELYDAFTLTKDENGVTEVVEQMPDTPEIRR